MQGRISYRKQKDSCRAVSRKSKTKVATGQSMAKVNRKTVIKVTKAVIMAVREADSLVNNGRQIPAISTLGSSALRQPMFDWKVADKYQELCNFKI